jgi:hypothetical protein
MPDSGNKIVIVAVEVAVAVSISIAVPVTVPVSISAVPTHPLTSQFNQHHR